MGNCRQSRLLNPPPTPQAARAPRLTDAEVDKVLGFDFHITPPAPLPLPQAAVAAPPPPVVVEKKSACGCRNHTALLGRCHPDNEGLDFLKCPARYDTAHQILFHRLVDPPIEFTTSHNFRVLLQPEVGHWDSTNYSPLLDMGFEGRDLRRCIAYFRVQSLIIEEERYQGRAKILRNEAQEEEFHLKINQEKIEHPFDFSPIDDGPYSLHGSVASSDNDDPPPPPPPPPGPPPPAGEPIVLTDEEKAYVSARRQSGSQKASQGEAAALAAAAKAKLKWANAGGPYQAHPDISDQERRLNVEGVTHSHRTHHTHITHIGLECRLSLLEAAVGDLGKFAKEMNPLQKAAIDHDK